MKLASQVFVSHSKPKESELVPTQGQAQYGGFHKPAGGLWTSTLNDEGGEWLRWLTGEGYHLEDERWGGKLWQLEPREANLFVVWGPKELSELCERYPHPLREKALDEVGQGSMAWDSMLWLVDWGTMAEDYEAVHIPNPWTWRFGLSGSEMGASMFFYSMDAECTCWFRWCFEGEPVELDPAPFLANLREPELA